MLILTRQKDQRILIQKGQIEITLLALREKRVALTISATPQTDLKLREKIYRVQNFVLLLSLEESLFLNQGLIEIKLLSIEYCAKREQARLGIKAPPEIDIDRLEVFLRKQAKLADLDESCAENSFDWGVQYASH